MVSKVTKTDRAICAVFVPWNTAKLGTATRGLNYQV